MDIIIANESTVLSDTQVEAWLPAFSTFAGHVRTYWPRPCTLKFMAAPLPTEAWQLLFLDDSDQAGALGYHDYTPGGKPISKVFAKTDLANGYSPTVTATHELAEMMADPWISELFQVSSTKLYAKEVGDPVEADALGYHITSGDKPSVLVSDFVTPAWFIPGHPGPIFDHAKRCSRPLQIMPGGYMSYWSGGGWHQVNAEGADVAFGPADARFRPRPDISA